MFNAIMTRRISFALIVITMLVYPKYGLAELKQECPRTLGSNNEFAPKWPKSDNWLGSESLAVILADHGIGLPQGRIIESQ